MLYKDILRDRVVSKVFRVSALKRENRQQEKPKQNDSSPNFFGSKKTKQEPFQSCNGNQTWGGGRKRKKEQTCASCSISESTSGTSDKSESDCSLKEWAPGSASQARDTNDGTSLDGLKIIEMLRQRN